MTYNAGAQLDAQLADHDARIAALEGADPVPIPPDPVPTPEGVDLLVDDVIVPAGLTQGQPATLGVMVTNQGDTATPTGAVVGVGFLLDDAQAGAQVTWVSTTAGLAAGASVQLDTATAENTGGPWVPTVEGAHTLTAFVDDLNRIVEAGPGSEANNRLTVDVQIAHGAVAPAGSLFVPGSLWNTRKTPGSFAGGADGRLRALSYGMNAGAYGHPMAFARNSDPTHTFDMPNSWGWPAGTQRFPMPDAAVPASGTDGHLCVLNRDTGDLVDMWQLHKVGDRHWSCSSWARHNWKTGTGWGQASPFLSAGVCVAGCPTGAGTITHDEVVAAKIPHAVCMAFDRNDQGGAGTCGGPQVYPAIANDVGGGPGPMAEGMLLLGQGAQPSGLNSAEAALWTAVSTYGAYVVDKLDGSPMFYLAESGDAGAFRADKVTAIGRALRAVQTW